MTHDIIKAVSELYHALGDAFAQAADSVTTGDDVTSDGGTAPRGRKKATRKKKGGAKRTRKVDPDPEAAKANENDPTHSLDDVQGLMQRIVKDFDEGNEIIREEFEKAGIVSLSKIPAAKIDGFFDTLEAILAE